jgi:hypothetical protein
MTLNLSPFIIADLCGTEFLRHMETTSFSLISKPSASSLSYFYTSNKWHATCERMASREMEEIKRRNRTLIKRRLARNQQNGQLKACNPWPCTVTFLGITLQLIRQWIRECGERHLGGWVDFAADCFLEWRRHTPILIKSNSGT